MTSPVDIKPTKPLNATVGMFDVAEDPNSVAVNDRVLAMAARGIEASETRQKAQAADKTEIVNQKTDANQINIRTVQQGLITQEELEPLEQTVRSTTEKSEVELELQDFFIEQGIFVEGVEYTPTDIRYQTNTLIAEQVFRDRLSKVQDETGTWGVVGDFMDRYFVRQLGLGWYEDVTKRTERRGRDLMQAAIEMEPEEYRSFITQYADEIAAEGVFTSENLFALQQGLDEATNAGYDPAAVAQQLLGILGAAEVASLAGKGFRSARALNKADGVVPRVAALEGPEKAAEVGQDILNVTGTTDADTLAKMGPEMLDTGTSVVRPHSSKVTEVLNNNSIIRKVRENDVAGHYGRMATPEQLDTIASRVTKSFTERVSNPIHTHRIVPDVLGNQVVEIDFGKIKDGTPYKNKTGAEKALANLDIPEGQVVPVDPEDLTKGYNIRVQQRLDLTEAAEAIDVSNDLNIVQDTVGRIFGSNALLDNDNLTVMANLAEAGTTKVRFDTRDLQKKLVGIKPESKRTISRIFQDLRDGIDAELREGYTRQEFKDKFKEKHPENRYPTQAEMDAYDAVVEFEDAGWLLRANEALIRYVKKGYWSLDLGGEVRTIGKKVTDVPEDTRVFNVNLNTEEKVTSIDVPVWRLDKPLPSGHVYISNPKGVNILDHSDVLGFNSGGRRLNPQARQFIVLDGDIPKAMMSAFSEKQAKEGVEQLKNIQSARKSNTLTDEIVQANNSWNPAINTVDDLEILIKEKDWDLNRTISYKQRDGQVVSEDTKIDAHVEGTWDSYVRVQNNRYDDVLMDYGGGTAYNVDPVSAILGEFGNAATHYTHRAYTYNAAAAWVKRAAQSGNGFSFHPAYAKNDYVNQVQHGTLEGTNATARELTKLRGVIRRRLKMQGPVERRFSQFGQTLSEFVFDKSGIKMNIGDPSSALMSVGFQSAFGFMAFSQFLMQGIHSLSIVAISPRAGAKAASMIIPLRGVMMAPTPEARAMGLKRLAKIVGESEETLKELADYIETSGRDIIDNDLIELGTGPSYGISGWQTESYLPSSVRNTLDKATSGGRKALDVGLLPFKTGERFSRLTGISTAFLEFKKKYPTKSALSDEGRRWITSREQTLTFNMTSTSRAAFQNGVLAIPTQWMSYTFRAMESVFIGKNLSGAERARLFAVLAPMYGLTGFGAGRFAEDMVEYLGIEDKEAYIFMKYGVIDWMVAEVAPFETALAKRLAPIDGITDLYKNIFQEGEATVAELVAGPSGAITGSIVSAFWETVQEVRHGNTVSLTQDALAILRQPSGLDAVAKGMGILRNGLYRSKTGAALPVEMKPSDAVAAFMGFSPLEVNEFYDRKGLQFLSDKKFRSFRKEMQKDYLTAVLAWRTDPNKGRALMKAVDTKIALSPFSPTQQEQIRGGLTVDNKELFHINRDLTEMDKQLFASMMEKILGDSN